MTIAWCKSKDQVFEGAKNSKIHKIETMSLKKYPEWFGYKTIDPICYQKYFLNNQRKLTNSKTYCLWTPFLTKCLECDIEGITYYWY